MTPEGIAFLKHIAANPDDDLPRLVFADWLDEHGYPERAEFVRLQIDRARRDDPTPSAREAELLRAHRELWLSVLPVGFRDGAEFRRGFLYGVQCNAESLLTPNVPILHLPIEEMAVVVDHLDLSMEAVHPPRLTLPLKSLSIDCQSPVGPRLFEFLDRFGPFDRLERLRIRDRWFGERDQDSGEWGPERLVPQPTFPRVVSLDLSWCEIDDPGAEALAESDWPRRLTELLLIGNRISPGRVAWLRQRFGAAAAVV